MVSNASLSYISSNPSLLWEHLSNLKNEDNEVKTNLVRQIMNSYTNAPELAQEEAIRSASMAAMQLMLAAKARGLDSCPMGGYNASLFMEAFGVPRHLVPVMLVAIGRKSVPAHPSTRLPVEETVIWNHF
jgi:nitroreductase